MAKRVRAEPMTEPDWVSTTVDMGWSDYTHKMAVLPEEAYRETAHRLQRLVAALEHGEGADAGVWRGLRGSMAIDPLPSCGTRPVPMVGLSTEVLAKIATDLDPAVGEDAAYGVLGSWADTLDLTDVVQRRALLSAMACAAFVIPPEYDRTALRAWLHDERRPSKLARAQALATSRAPYAPWRAREVAEGWALESVLPLRPWWHPPALQLDAVGGVDGGLVDGGLLFARLVPGEHAWTVVAPLALPSVPPEAWWRGAVLRSSVLLQAENRSLRLEDLLRRVGHRLCRDAHQWWWSRR